MKSQSDPTGVEMAADISPATLKALYTTMLRIRRVEEQIAELLCSKPEIVCPVHLYTGQEAVAAGVCDIALAVGVEKLKDAGIGLPPPPIGDNTIADTGVDPLRLIPPPVAFGSQAVLYFHKYGLSPEDGKRLLAKIAVKNHHNGSLNPKAQYQNEITLEQAINAPMVSWPLGVLDCCGVTDGAAAAIVTRADMAKKFRDDPVYIKSFGVASGARQASIRPDYDFTHFEENVRASKQPTTGPG